MDVEELRPFGEEEYEDDANNFDTFGGDAGAIGDDWLPSNAQAVFEHERRGLKIPGGADAGPAKGQAPMRPPAGLGTGSPWEASGLLGSGDMPPGLNAGGKGGTGLGGASTSALFQPGAIAAELEARLEQALGGARRPSVQDSDAPPPGLGPADPPPPAGQRRPPPASPHQMGLDVDRQGLLDLSSLPPTAGLDQLGLGSALGLQGPGGSKGLGTASMPGRGGKASPAAGLAPPPYPGGLGLGGLPPSPAAAAAAAAAAGLPGFGGLGAGLGGLPPGPPSASQLYSDYLAMAAYAASRGLPPPPAPPLPGGPGALGGAPPGLLGAGRGSLASSGRMPPGLGSGASPVLQDYLLRSPGAGSAPPPYGGLLPPGSALAGAVALQQQAAAAEAARAKAAAATLAAAAAKRPPPATATPPPAKAAAAAADANRSPKVLSVTELEQQMLTSTMISQLQGQSGARPKDPSVPPAAKPLAATSARTEAADEKAARGGAAAPPMQSTSSPPGMSPPPAKGSLAQALAGQALPPSPLAEMPAAMEPEEAQAGRRQSMNSDMGRQVSALDGLVPGATGPIVPLLRYHCAALVAGSERASQGYQDAQQFVPPKSRPEHPQLMGASDKELVSRIQLSQLAALTSNQRLFGGGLLGSPEDEAKGTARVSSGFRRNPSRSKAELKEKLLACLGQEVAAAGADKEPDSEELSAPTASSEHQDTAARVVRTAQMCCERASAALLDLEQLSPHALKADATAADHERSEKVWRELLPPIMKALIPSTASPPGAPAPSAEATDATGEDSQCHPPPEPGDPELCKTIFSLRKGRVMVGRLLSCLTLAVAAILPRIASTAAGQDEKEVDGESKADGESKTPNAVGRAVLMIVSVSQLVLLLLGTDVYSQELFCEHPADDSWAHLREKFFEAVSAMGSIGGNLWLFGVSSLLGLHKWPAVQDSPVCCESSAVSCQRLLAVCSSQDGVAALLALIRSQCEAGIVKAPVEVSDAVEKQLGKIPSQEAIVEELQRTLAVVAPKLVDKASATATLPADAGEADAHKALKEASEEDIMELFLAAAGLADDSQKSRLRLRLGTLLS